MLSKISPGFFKSKNMKNFLGFLLPGPLRPSITPKVIFRGSRDDLQALPRETLPNSWNEEVASL